MRLLRALAALVLLSLLTVACTDDGPDASDPSATWSPTGKMETPTPSPSAPVEPVLPDAAAEASEAGARAFIEHYWDLINYAQATGDVKLLKKASGRNCDGCNSGIRSIRELYEEGGHLEGGEYTIEISALNTLGDPTPQLFAVEAKLTATASKQKVVRGDGGTETNAAGTSDVIVAAAWRGKWQLEAMQLP